MYRILRRKLLPRLRKTQVLLCCCTLLLVMVYLLSREEITYDLEPEPIAANPAEEEDERPQYVTLPTAEPPKGGIFLLEGHGNPRVNLRMCCALESAALAHPQHPVTLVMTSPEIRNSKLMQTLSYEFSNLQLLHLDLDQLFHSSPLEAWYKDRRWEESTWPLYHFSDSLRWLLIWKYGGVYLDLDVVVLRSLTKLPNCTAMESDKMVSAGVLKFTPAHPLIRACLDHFARHFDGSVWGANGPELLTEVLTERCGLELPSGRTPGCPDVNVMPPRAFYPLPWWEWQRYVMDDIPLADELQADPRVYVIHVWNYHLRHALVNLSSNQPYALIAHAHCPITMAYAGDFM